MTFQINQSHINLSKSTKATEIDQYHITSDYISIWIVSLSWTVPRC